MFKIFRTLFGKADVELADSPQTNVLVSKLRGAKISHGKKAVVNLNHVRIENGTLKRKPITMYFCPMNGVQIIKHLQKGDGGRLPENSKLDGLKIDRLSKSGIYNLKNVIIYPNGKVNIIQTPKTKFEFVEEY